MILLYARFYDAQDYIDPVDSRIYGTLYKADYSDFDVATEAIVALTTTYDDSGRTSPPQDFSFAGEFFSKCVGTTRHSYAHDGTGNFSVVEEPDSVSCGFVPPAPLTCDLVLAFQLTPTETGATLTASSQAAHGAVQYRLDGGPPQPSPTFYLSPGRYVLTANDTGVNGCARSVAVTVATPPPPTPPVGPPDRVDFVEQPLWYRVAAPTGAEVLLELYAESQHGAEDFALVLRVRRRADAAGRVNFRLDPLLSPLLSAEVPPASTAAVVICRRALLNYFVRTATFLPARDRPPTYATSPLRTALRGALPAERRDVDYFQYRLAVPEYPPFLSWQPGGKRLTAEQPEWLFWLCPDGRVPVLTVRRSYARTGFALALSEVQEETVNLSAGRGPLARLLAIPVRPRAGMDAMTVALYDGLGVQLSPVASYTMVPATPRSRYLLFSNSLGGFDVLRTEGRLEGVLEATAERYERPAQPGGPAVAAERQAFDVAATRKLKLATGWLTAAQLRWLQELVLAREIWEWQAGRLLPLDPAKRQLAYASDDAPLRGMLLEFDYAFAPTAYADLP